MRGTRELLMQTLERLQQSAKSAGTPNKVTIAALAKAAGVDRSLLYKTHRDVADRVRGYQRTAKASQETVELQRKLATIKERLKQRDIECAALARLFVELAARHESEVQALRERNRRLERGQVLRLVAKGRER